MCVCVYTRVYTCVSTSVPAQGLEVCEGETGIKGAGKKAKTLGKVWLGRIFFGSEE